MLSHTEENYIKVIYNIHSNYGKAASTNAIADVLKTAPATVTDMLKKLADKKFVKYEKYKGVILSKTGKEIAIKVIRKHRIWETFLVNILHFRWDEVHSMAEQLEHVQNDELIDRLHTFLGNPKTDPHGDVIPDKLGKMISLNTQNLLQIEKNNIATVAAVADQSVNFLNYIEKLKIKLGCKIKILDINNFDGSLEIKIDNNPVVTIGSSVAENLLMRI